MGLSCDFDGRYLCDFNINLRNFEKRHQRYNQENRIIYDDYISRTIVNRTSLLYYDVFCLRTIKYYV